MSADEFDDELDEWLDGQQTVRKPRETRTCRYCKQDILVRNSKQLAKHEGPCGLPCLGGGVGVGLPFHDDHCSHPKCWTPSLPSAYRRKKPG